MRVVLFTGKGGVGKTTLAAATAAHLARSGRKALVVSTDPAHSLGDALEAELTGEPTEIESGLFAAHIDTRALLDSSWGQLQGHLRTVLAGAGVDELVADELTVLPGIEDLLALGEVRRLAETGLWEVVVVDCGPTAETLRLLGLPEAISGYIERLFPSHRRAVRGLLAGLAGAGKADGPGWDATVDALDALAEQLAGLRVMLGDHTRTSIRLVLTPERVVAAETRRTVTALALHGLAVDGIVVNRVVPGPPPSLRGPAARWLRERHDEQQSVLADLDGLGEVPLRAVDHTAAEPTGIPALLEVAANLYGDTDPAAPGEQGPPLLHVRRTAGSGTSRDSEFELVLRLPGAADGALDLARVGDELAVAVGPVRRMVALPSVLRRCGVTGARLDGDDLCVVFTPDPALWISR
ncbi:MULTISPECIES: ArsA family ATPase [unclassified Pseudonocardia]|uniref:ArsA family ATPase n=1 Tax=unclassified Pseudonocardia TaxID=2619320 RepID=UPI000959EB02|nr:MULTISPECIES: ArsA family ATPase [unclassified Pseudonocardia]MBN9100368.1 ArsA family ATPase [Pseudonocardia sp.]OJY50117.1 MAG: arsenic-transporting ATPase [Pseudonocardia sp. 73-21]